MEWVCKLCGFKDDEESPPEVCPVCGAPASQFKEHYGDGMDEEVNVGERLPTELNDFEKDLFADYDE